jgi:uncharacterized protein (TIGR04141 family)
LESNAADLNSLGYADLKSHGLKLKNENDELLRHFSILNCLIFDAASDTEQSYHLSDGKWYRVENSYLEKLKASLDPLCIEAPLRPFAHESEGKYNEAVAEEDGSFICLDMTNISPRGETQIEPCDLYSVDGRLGIFGSAQESVRRRVFRGFCSRARIGYSPPDARQRLDAGIGVAGLQGLPA